MSVWTVLARRVRGTLEWDHWEFVENPLADNQKDCDARRAAGLLITVQARDESGRFVLLGCLRGRS